MSRDFQSSIVHTLSYRGFEFQDFHHIIEHISKTDDFSLNLNHVIIEDSNYFPFILSLSIGSLYSDNKEVKNKIKDSIESHFKSLRYHYDVNKKVLNLIISVICFYDIIKLKKEFPEMFDHFLIFYKEYLNHRHLDSYYHENGILHNLLHKPDDRLYEKYQLFFLILVGDIKNIESSLIEYDITRNQFFEIISDIMHLHLLNNVEFLEKFKDVHINNSQKILDISMFIDYLYENKKYDGIDTDLVNYISSYYIKNIFYSIEDKFREVVKKLLKISKVGYLILCERFISNMCNLGDRVFGHKISTLNHDELMSRKQYSNSFNAIFDILYQESDGEVFNKIDDFKCILFFEQACLLHSFYNSITDKDSFLEYLSRLYHSRLLDLNFLTQIFETIEDVNLRNIFGSSYDSIKSIITKYHPKYTKIDLKYIFENNKYLKLESMLKSKGVDRNNDRNIDKNAKLFLDRLIKRFHQRVRNQGFERIENHDMNEHIKKDDFEAMYYREKEINSQINRISYDEKQMIKVLVRYNVFDSQDLEDILEIFLNSDESNEKSNIPLSISGHKLEYPVISTSIFASIPHYDQI